LVSFVQNGGATQEHGNTCIVYLLAFMAMGTVLLMGKL
jgi:hypothetical protein